MNKIEEKKLRDIIESEIIETKKSITNLEKLVSPVSPDNALGRLTRLDAIGSKSLNEAALRQARDKVNKLRYALANLGTPGFGICAECEKTIPYARILIMPHSTLCVQCAEDLEESS